MRIWLTMTLSVLALVAVIWLLLRDLPDGFEWIRIAAYAAVVVIGGVSTSIVKRRSARKRSAIQSDS